MDTIIDKLLTAIAVISIGGIIILATVFIYCSIKYKCISGHYEYRMEFNAAAKTSMYQNVWVCDKEILRSEYNKHPERYRLKNDCDCQ